LRLARFLALYRRHFRDHRRERMFIASLCFFLTFSTARIATHVARARENTFSIVIGGIHIHHLVWGIALLLVVGYLWLIQVDGGPNRTSARIGRLTAILYGVGAALTLDEFARWLRLDDVYWQRAGHLSVDAVVMFGALVSAGLWGGPFLRAMTRQVARIFRRHGGPREPAGLPAALPGEQPLVSPAGRPSEIG